MRHCRSYQLEIVVPRRLRCVVGRLGTFVFPAGIYVYTGSAKRNLEARIARHLRRDKALRWHIDYLLTAPGVQVVSVIRSRRGECELNQACDGESAVPGFGASDCGSGCSTHLKRIGTQQRTTGQPGLPGLARRSRLEREQLFRVLSRLRENAPKGDGVSR